MTTNRLFSILLVIVVMGTVVLTIRESAATSVAEQQVREAQRIQLSQDAENARWLAMASFYEKQASEAWLTDSQLGKPLTSYDEAEATAYRWQATAKFYQKQQEMVCSWQLPKPLTEYDAAEADAYRWQAICTYYVQHGVATIR